MASFVVGDQVILDGLKAKPELNGLGATVVGPIGSDGRVPVRVRAGEPGMTVKPENLCRAAGASASGSALQLSEEEHARQPQPHEIEPNLAYAMDRANSRAVRLDCLKVLAAHAEKPDQAHHEQLAVAAVPARLIELLGDEAEEKVFRSLACGVLQNFAGHAWNVSRLLSSGIVPALARQLEGNHLPVARETALSTLVHLCEERDGSAAVGDSRVPAALVAIVSDRASTEKALEVSLIVLGKLMYHKDNWERVLGLGALQAAAAAMRREGVSQATRQFGAGLMYVTCRTSVSNREQVAQGECAQALLEMAKAGSVNGKARELAVKALAACGLTDELAQKGE
jgi:hypothetical protein